MFSQLFDQVSIDDLLTTAAGAAGTADINSDEVDTQNWDGVMFIVKFGPIVSGAVTSIKAQQDTVTGMAGAADLAGTGITVADTDDDKLKVLDIFKPRERFVRCVVDRATQNATVNSIVGIRYRGRKFPSTHAAEVAGEKHASPAEGTA